MKGITRARPKIDRIARPWLIARFIDSEPEFLFVPSGDVLRIAAAAGAVPCDIPGVELSHAGKLCSFDAFLSKYHLVDPALAQLAVIVRGADSARLDLAPQAAGLLALSLGLSHNSRMTTNARSRDGDLRCALRMVPSADAESASQP